MFNTLENFSDTYAVWWQDVIDMLAADMTQEMADYIKQLRCVRGYSCKNIASDFYSKYHKYSKEYSIRPNSQISGMQLCETAQKILNEKDNNEWT